MGASANVAAELFKLLDENGNGVLDMEEWKKAAHFLAQVSEDFNEDPDAAFRRMDKNNDNEISKDEFIDQIKMLTEVVGAREINKAMAAACRAMRGIK